MRIDRLREEMGRLELSQASLGRAVGASQGAIQQILNGSTGRTRKLPEIARELGVSVSYLLGETDERQGAPLAPLLTEEQMIADLGLVRIPEVDIGYGMGGGSWIDEYAPQRARHFDEEWLASITRSPASALFVASGIGDSMFPTLHDSDRLLIDRGQNRINQQDRIWALSVGEVSMVKRVRRVKDAFLLMSDNELVSDYEVTGDELHVVGRVIWISRRA